MKCEQCPGMEFIPRAVCLLLVDIIWFGWEICNTPRCRLFPYYRILTRIVIIYHRSNCDVIRRRAQPSNHDSCSSIDHQQNGLKQSKPPMWHRRLLSERNLCGLLQKTILKRTGTRPVAAESRWCVTRMTPRKDSIPHETRTAAEPRQNRLYTVRLAHIEEINPSVRLLRLSLTPEVPINGDPAVRRPLSTCPHYIRPPMIKKGKKERKKERKKQNTKSCHRPIANPKRPSLSFRGNGLMFTSPESRKREDSPSHRPQPMPSPFQLPIQRSFRMGQSNYCISRVNLGCHPPDRMGDTHM